MRNFFAPTTHRARAFTLVETLVAIAILTVAVAGPLFTANTATVATNVAHDRVTASYLAQEGIEYVRMMRDNAFLASGLLSDPGWSAFVGGPISSCVSGPCVLTPSHPTGVLSACSGACPVLYIANNQYTQDSGAGGAQATPFTRTIQFTEGKYVTATVFWSYRETVYSVEIKEELTAWQ
jgi:prepilin-type N-terminal cleavage/methylation domain-containing protein